MVTTRCHGRFFGGRNACDCPECRERDRLRGDWLTASGRYHRLRREAGDLTAADPRTVVGVVRADVARQAAGDRWAAWEAGGAQADAEAPEAVAS